MHLILNNFTVTMNKSMLSLIFIILFVLLAKGFFETMAPQSLEMTQLHSSFYAAIY